MDNLVARISMRKMKIETTIQNLKKMHESYKAEVARLEQEFEAVSAKLENYRNLVSRTSDSIDALEGRTSELREQLTQALQTRTEPLGVAVGDASLRGGSFPLPANLPPAEEGFQWAQNEIGEWVLTPQAVRIAQNALERLIELPLISDDENFADSPTDFIK